MDVYIMSAQEEKVRIHPLETMNVYKMCGNPLSVNNIFFLVVD